MAMTLEDFKSSLTDNIDFLKVEWESLESYSDRQFCKQLLDWYDRKGYLSNSQMEYLVKYITKIMENSYAQG